MGALFQLLLQTLAVLIREILPKLRTFAILWTESRVIKESISTFFRTWREPPSTSGLFPNEGQPGPFPHPSFDILRTRFRHQRNFCERTQCQRLEFMNTISVIIFPNGGIVNALVYEHDIPEDDISTVFSPPWCYTFQREQIKILGIWNLECPTSS